MPRVSVYVSDELLDTVRAELPAVNFSAALQAGLRSLLECDHTELACAACGDTVQRHDLTGPVLERFYRAVMRRLGENVDRPGYEGAARLVRTIAADHAVPGLATTALPRPSRAQLEARAEVVPLDLEQGARRRHPTSHQPTQEQTA